MIRGFTFSGDSASENYETGFMANLLAGEADKAAAAVYGKAAIKPVKDY